MESKITAKISTYTSEGIKELHFWDLVYWFENPEKIGLAELGVLIVLSSLILFLGLVSTFLAWKNKSLIPPQKKFFIKNSWYLFGFASLAFLLVVFRALNVPYASIRLLWLIFFVGLGLLVYFQSRFYFSKMPIQKAQYESYLVKKRYFPKKKKK